MSLKLNSEEFGGGVKEWDSTHSLGGGRVALGGGEVVSVPFVVVVGGVSWRQG